MRSLRLVPSSRPLSNNCISTGAETAIHPDPDWGATGAGSGRTSDAVAPDSIVTVCFVDPRSLSRSRARHLDVLSDLAAGGNGHRDDLHAAGASQLESVRSRVQLDRQRRLAAR